MIRRKQTRIRIITLMVGFFLAPDSTAIQIMDALGSVFREVGIAPELAHQIRMIGLSVTDQFHIAVLLVLLDYLGIHMLVLVDKFDSPEKER